MAKARKAQAAVTPVETVTPAAAPAVTPAAAVQATPAKAVPHIITNRQRHLLGYIEARKTLAVLPAAHVSYAFLTFGQAHGLQAAVDLLPALVAAAQALPQSAFEGLSPKTQSPAFTAQLIAAAAGSK